MLKKLDLRLWFIAIVGIVFMGVSSWALYTVNTADANLGSNQPVVTVPKETSAAQSLDAIDKDLNSSADLNTDDLDSDLDNLQRIDLSGV
jgi:hypothetical protein